MRWAVSSWLAISTVFAGDSVAQQGEAVAARADESFPFEEVLGRTPADLPKAEPGRWEGLLDETTSEHLATFVAPGVLETAETQSWRRPLPRVPRCALP